MKTFSPSIRGLLAFTACAAVAVSLAGCASADAEGDAAAGGPVEVAGVTIEKDDALAALVPEKVAEAGMELLGARVCLYGRGLAAHLMYRHNGQPVSVFMIPEMSRAKSVVDVMGHEAAIWSRDGRTFVLVAREPENQAAAVADLSHMTEIVQAVLH